MRNSSLYANYANCNIYVCTVPEQKVVISNFLKLEDYGNCDAYMYHVNTMCSNLHAYVRRYSLFFYREFI